MASYLKADEQGAVAAAADLLMGGHLVVFPTDTVYGVGAHAFDNEAISRLYQVKRRSSDKAIPILLADMTDIYKVAAIVPGAAANLIDRFWPGPLTLIVPKHPDLPAVISPNDGVAVRIPNNEVARRLISATGGAVATSSANLSGNPPACTGDQAMSELGGLVAAVVDGGPCGKRVASTIVDCRGETPVIVREGQIPATHILQAGSVTL